MTFTSRLLLAVGGLPASPGPGGNSISPVDSQPALAAAPAEPVTRLVTRPIQYLRLGQRVLADNPLLPPDQATPSDIDRAHWRQIGLRMPKPGGGSVDIELLRPVVLQL